MPLLIFGLVTNEDEKNKIAAIVIFDFRSMCEQNKMSMHTKKFRQDLTIFDKVRILAGSFTYDVIPAILKIVAL